MSVKIENPDFLDGLAIRVGRAVREATKRKIEKKVRHGFDILLDRTPIWSGDTVANYRVVVGQTLTAGGALGVGVTVPYEPYNQEEDPFSTELVAPDRDDAESRARASLEVALDQWKRMEGFGVLYFVNPIKYDNGQGIEALEYGEVGREAYGMFAAARQAMENI